jgi:copper chaperone CopZ
MSCQHCVGRVKQILEDFDQVERADPDLTSGFVRIQGTALDRQTLAAAVTRAGYGVADTD